MIINFSVLMVINFSAALMSLLIIVFFMLKGRKSALLYSFIAFQFLVFVWLVRIITFKLMLNGGNNLSDFIPGMSFEYYEMHNYKLRYYIVCLTGLCWLVFCLIYTDVRVFKDKRLLSLILSLPLMFYLSVALYENWLQYRNMFTATFWLHTFMRYFCFAAGIIVLISRSRKQPPYIKKQVTLLVLSILLPVVLSFLQDYKRHLLLSGGIIYDFDITPVGFTYSMLIIFFATYKYRFLNVMPMALRRLVDDLNQAIIFVDRMNYVINFNKSVSKTFRTGKQIKRNSNIETFLCGIETELDRDEGYFMFEAAIKDKSMMEFRGEICLLEQNRKYISVSIHPIYAKSSKALGRVISFNDITEYKGLINEINEKNKRLEEYAGAVEELTLVRERNRFARDIHDTLGHTMTMLIALLEVSSITCSKEDEITQNKLKEAARISREGLKELQRSISGLIPEKLYEEDFAAALEILADGFRSLDLTIDIDLDENINIIDKKTSEAIYRACQEAMTNSVRHGNATHIDIIIKFSDKKLKLFIIDDGCGCKNIQASFGLSGMQQRIGNLNGTVVFGSDGESGFNVRIEIPVEDSLRSVAI